MFMRVRTGRPPGPKTKWVGPEDWARDVLQVPSGLQRNDPNLTSLPDGRRIARLRFAGEWESSPPCPATDAGQSRGAPLAFYARIREEHWLRDKQDDGSIVILEDASIWEIRPSDRPTAAHWLRISTVRVKYTEEHGYPYLLTNTTEDDETARAKYLGDVTRSTIEAA